MKKKILFLLVLIFLINPVFAYHDYGSREWEHRDYQIIKTYYADRFIEKRAYYPYKEIIYKKPFDLHEKPKSYYDYYDKPYYYKEKVFYGQDYKIKKCYCHPPYNKLFYIKCKWC